MSPSPSPVPPRQINKRGALTGGYHDPTASRMENVKAIKAAEKEVGVDLRGGDCVDGRGYEATHVWIGVAYNIQLIQSYVTLLWALMMENKLLMLRDPHRSPSSWRRPSARCRRRRRSSGPSTPGWRCSLGRCPSRTWPSRRGNG